MKRKLKFQNYKKCVEVAQIGSKINHLERNKIDADSLKGFIKINNLILKTQQRIKIERHDFFAGEINY